MNESSNPWPVLKKLAMRAKIMASLYYKYLQIHCKQWHVFTHLPEKLVCLGPARSNNCLAVLHQGDWDPGPKANSSCILEKQPPFPSQRPQGTPLSSPWCRQRWAGVPCTGSTRSAVSSHTLSTFCMPGTMPALRYREMGADRGLLPRDSWHHSHGAPGRAWKSEPL